MTTNNNHLLAIEHFKGGEYLKSVEYFEKAIQQNMLDSEAHKSIIEIAMHIRLSGVLKLIDRALKLFPETCDFWNYKALYLKQVLELDLAKTCFLQALKFSTTNIEKSSIWINLGSVYGSRGDIDTFVKCCEKAVSLCPDRNESHINLAFMNNYYSDTDKPHDQFLESVYEKIYASVIPKLLDNPVEYSRIGYVTSDLVGSACSRFMDAILNHSTMDVFIYSNKPVPTDLSANWPNYRDISSMEDHQVISLIRKDKIGHLVDLSGLTMGHRNSLFWKLQKHKRMKLYSYLGYPANVCIPGMVRISDEYTEINEDNNSKVRNTPKVIKLPRFFLCYNNDKQLLTFTSTERPDRPLTFGSFAKLEKINQSVINLWKRLMDECLKREIPAQFLIKSRYFENESTRKLWFDKLGNTHNFRLISGALDDYSHMQQYQQLDVQLDTFPYSGTTVSCDSLFMNVPVVTLKGNKHVERVTASLLSSMGLESSMVASSKEEYIEKAINVGLNSRSYSVREKFLELMNPNKFMDDYEKIFK